MADLLEPIKLTHIDQPGFLLGPGVQEPSAGIQGDEEDLYTIEPLWREGFYEPSDWAVRVSGHAIFPRWEAPTEEAFDLATWALEGPLPGPLEVIGGQSI